VTARDDEHPFRGVDLAGAIARRAEEEGILLDSRAIAALVLHARAVVENNASLHLTTIVEPEAFIERHLGEAFAGAALLPEEIRGLLVDLGSGNGYPGIPIAAARAGLTVSLVESSRKKASFLRNVLVAAGFEPRVSVLERRVERARDLEGLGPIAVLAARAVGGWQRILPKLAPSLAPDGIVLLWAGSSVTEVVRRERWRRFELVGRRPLRGRERCFIWQFAKARERGSS